MVLDIADSPRLATLSAKRLPEIERAENLNVEVRALLEARWGHLAARRRAGKWLEGAEYAALLRYQDHLREVRRALTLRTPAGRIAALERVRTAVGGGEAPAEAAGRLF